MRTLCEQAAAVRERRVSSTELVRAALDAIERVQPSLNAFTCVLGDEAIARAAALDAAEPAGPLHGVPIAIKDLFDVRGVPTTGCTEAYRARPPAGDDAAVVERLRAAGAIVVAKCNQHELAVGATNRLSCFGPVFNPWGTGRIAGGSSGGSGAAVAAGVVALAMGSDTGGSIRIPASFCGVTGLKPTHGAVSLRGAMPLSPSLDTAGPLAASAADCALALGVLAGFDPADPASRSGRFSPPPGDPGRVRLAIPGSFLSPLHPETRAALDAAATVFEAMGAAVIRIDGPPVEQALELGGRLMFAEFTHYYRDLWDSDRVHPEIAALLSWGRSLSALDVVEAMEFARELANAFARAFAAADVILAPATPYPAPPMDSSEVAVEGGTLDVHLGGPARLMVPANLAGLPALALPAGFSSDGMPIGIQIIGPAWSDEVLLALGRAFQEATSWHRRIREGQAGGGTES